MNLRTIRERLGLRQIRLAGLAGMNRSRLCFIERGYVDASREEETRLRAALLREIERRREQFEEAASWLEEKSITQTP